MHRFLHVEQIASTKLRNSFVETSELDKTLGMSSSVLTSPRYFAGATLVLLCALGCGDDSSDSNLVGDDAGPPAPDAATSDDSMPTETETPVEAGPGDDTTTSDTDPTSEPDPEDGGGTTPTDTGEVDTGTPRVDAATPEPIDGGELDSGTALPEDASSPTVDPGPDVDAAADDAGTGGGDFEGVEETPLLERSATQAYACEVSTEATLLGVESGFDAALVGVGDTVWYARSETPFSGGATPSLELSPLELDASLGASVTLGSSELDGYYSTQVVATPTGLLIFALQYGQDGTALQLAATSLEGEVTREATAIEGLNGGAERYAVAVGSDDIGLLFSRYTNTGDAMYYVTLDFDGTPLSEPKLVRANPNAVSPAAITATSQGYLFSYVMGFQPSQMFTQTADSEGTLGTPVPVAVNNNGLSNAQSMLVRGDEVLLAWTDTGGSWDNSDLDRTTILSRLDLDGQRVAQDVRVQSPEMSVERVSPRLLERGDDLGLLWSEGSVIYICAGCMPDNHVQFVMLDGATLSPASDVLTLTNPAQQGGLVYPTGSWRGDDLSVAAAVGYHTNGEGAAGTISCVAQ